MLSLPQQLVTSTPPSSPEPPPSWPGKPCLLHPSSRNSLKSKSLQNYPKNFPKDSSINTKTLQTPLLILSVQALAPGRQLPWQQTWTDKDECCAQCRAFSPICLKNVAPAWPFIRARHVDSQRNSVSSAVLTKSISTYNLIIIIGCNMISKNKSS